MIPVGLIAGLLVYAIQSRRKATGTATAASSDGTGVLYAIVITVGFFVLFPLIATATGSPGIGAAAALWGVTVGGHFTAWRICRPLRLRFLGRLFLRLGPHSTAGKMHGRLLVYDAAFGHGKLSLVAQADPWSTCASALYAEQAGNPREASRWIDGLLAVPLGPSLPGSLRRHGGELLAEAAAARGDWAETARRASFGRGRGARFWRLVARAHLQGDVSPAVLCCAFLLAPQRKSRRRWLEAALARPRQGPAEPFGPVDGRGGPWKRHLQRLQEAAQGKQPSLPAVLEVARLWDEALAPAGAAQFQARGLELGNARPAQTFSRLRDEIVADLTTLARGTRGSWPEGPRHGLVAELYLRLHDEGAEAIDAIARTRRADKRGDLGYALDEWRLWLRFRAATEELASRFGESALRNAWYGGAQLAAWNWPCHLLDLHGKKSAWACHVMFRWATEIAERCGDDEAARVNRKNSAVALQQASA